MLSYFPQITFQVFQEYYNLDNLLKALFAEKISGYSKEEYTLEKKLKLFESLLNFARDFILLAKKNKESFNFQKVNKKFIIFL